MVRRTEIKQKQFDCFRLVFLKNSIQEGKYEFCEKNRKKASKKRRYDDEEMEKEKESKRKRVTKELRGEKEREKQATVGDASREFITICLNDVDKRYIASDRIPRRNEKKKSKQ